MAEQQYQPDYLMWFELEFMADRYVVRMTPHQRLMYRSLCQTALFCSTRPYLPDDDDELAMLADADTAEHWQQNKAAVMKKFYKVDGKWAHKRLLKEWERIMAVVEKNRERAARGGRAKAAKSASSNPEASEKHQPGATPDTEHRNTDTEHGRGTATDKPNSPGSGAVGGNGSSSVSQDTVDKPGTGSVDRSRVDGRGLRPLATLGEQGITGTVTAAAAVNLLNTEWQTHKPGRPWSDQSFASLPVGTLLEMRRVLRWALTVSNYWSDPARLASGEDFAKEYFGGLLKKQYQKYADRISSAIGEGEAVGKKLCQNCGRSRKGQAGLYCPRCVDLFTDAAPEREHTHDCAGPFCIEEIDPDCQCWCHKEETGLEAYFDQERAKDTEVELNAMSSAFEVVDD
jgi:uncharacterized protein YdaU (DUF1376 family)